MGQLLVACPKVQALVQLLVTCPKLQAPAQLLVTCAKVQAPVQLLVTCPRVQAPVQLLITFPKVQAPVVTCPKVQDQRRTNKGWAKFSCRNNKSIIKEWPIKTEMKTLSLSLCILSSTNTTLTKACNRSRISRNIYLRNIWYSIIHPCILVLE